MVTARSLSPGDEGALEISFDGVNRSGQQEKTVRVTSNDPEKEVVTVTIRAFVRASISLEPQVARVGAIGFDEERVVQLKLKIEDPDQVSITRIESSAPGVSGVILDGASDAEESILEVTFAAGRSAGKFEETLRLHTNLPEKPRIDVPVTGRVQGEIRLEPEAIGFQSRGRPDPSATPIQVNVKNVGPNPFRITGVEDSTGFLTTVVEEADPGVSYVISVGLAVDGSEPVPDSFTGQLRILTDHPDQPVLELPVYRTSGKKTR